MSVEEAEEEDRLVRTDTPRALLNEHYRVLQRDSTPKPVFRVVLTGGPCAGKTTALAVLEERMRSRGFRVFVVPEAATTLITGGAMFSDLNTPENTKIFQATLLRTQVALEDSFVRLASMCGEPSVVISDRGVMDGSAYMTEKLWTEMLEENNWNVVALRDQRYDSVLHLVTAADGAKEFYTLENNKTRHETIEEAIALDVKLRNAWIGHPRLRVIDNRSAFPEKMNRAFNMLCNLVGLPQSPGVSRKFIVKGDISRLISSIGSLQQFEVDQTVLIRTEEDVEESVRRRGKRHGMSSYVHGVRRTGKQGNVVELKRNITEREYLTHLARADPTRRTLRLWRSCFLYMDVYYIVDQILNIDQPLTLLRTHTDTMDTEIVLPLCIKLEEVTGMYAYSVHCLSRKVTPIRRFEYETSKAIHSSIDLLGTSV